MKINFKPLKIFEKFENLKTFYRFKIFAEKLVDKFIWPQLGPHQKQLGYGPGQKLLTIKIKQFPKRKKVLRTILGTEIFFKFFDTVPLSDSKSRLLTTSKAKISSINDGRKYVNFDQSRYLR